MRNLLLALLLALAVLPARAATDPPATGPTYQQFRNPDRFMHVAIIRPSRWKVLSAANVQSLRQSCAMNVGTTWESCEMRGLEVHFYDTDFFESDKDHREMWTDLGAKYALAIVEYPTSSAASFARYICQDSTNAQLLVIGGTDLGAGTSWGADTLATNLLSGVRGFVDTKGFNYEGISSGGSSNGAFLLTNDGVDTLWGARLATGRRMTTLPAGISRVVRLLRPGTFSPLAGHHTFVQDADSVNSNMPGDVSGNPEDTTAAFNDYLGPMWKVTYANRSGENNTNNGAGQGTWINSLGIGNGPNETYFLKFPSQGSFARCYPHYLWSLICRFTKARPIPYAIDWDDVTDKFFDNNGQPPRWRSTAADSSIEGLRGFGMFPGLAVNPRHASAYVRGEDPDYESPWSGRSMRYLQGRPWFHHSHDSTQSHIGGSLIGYGGYGTGNGNFITITLNGGVVGTPEVMGHRYASRRNPGANEGDFIGAAGNFGIQTRLAWMDSVRKAVCPTCSRPPYLALPANQFLPVNRVPRPCLTGKTSPWTLYKTAKAFQSVTSNGTTTLALGAGNWADSSSVLPGKRIIGTGTLGIMPNTTIVSVAGANLTLSQAAGTGTGIAITWADEIPADSLLWAFDLGVLGGNGTERRYWYFRTAIDNPRGGNGNSLGTTGEWDRDSIPASAPSVNPGERWVARVGGRYVQGVPINSFLEGAGSPCATGRTQYVADATFRTAWLLGLKNPVLRSEQANAMLGESFNTDVMGLYGTTGPAYGPHDFTARQATRVLYQHPGQHGDTFTANGDCHVDTFLRSIGPQIRGMDKVAGRACTRCVYAWQVYDTR